MSEQTKKNVKTNEEVKQHTCCPYCFGEWCSHPRCIRMPGFECDCMRNKKNK